jgi:hypothetical protein
VPIEVGWDNAEKTTLRYDYEGNWSWEELYEISNQALGMFNSVPHRVDVIHNHTNSTHIPRRALSHAQRLVAQYPENWGISVVVGTNPLLKGLMQVFRRVYRQMGERHFMAATLEQAHQLLTERPPVKK